MNETRRRAAPMSPDERRDAIVRVVVPLLERHGGHVTTRQLAQEAGIAEGTIFRVFPDKRALFVEAARQAVAPPGWREHLESVLAEHPSLRGKVVTVVQAMAERTRRLLLVMGALRGAALADTHEHPHRAGPPGVPPFLAESGRRLLETLTELVFEPHRHELVVPPERAARALQALVMGTWHPGATDPDRLTPDEITDVLLRGVAGPGHDGGQRCC